MLAGVCVANAQVPANNTCANAINLTVGSACTAGTTVNSTFDGNSPSCGGAPTDGNVWYKFTATSIKSVIDLSNVVNIDPVLSVYATCGGASIQCADNGLSDEGETITFTTVIGTVYLINVQQYDAFDGTFCVAVSNFVPPANDDCANAINVTVGAACTAGTTVYSSFDGNSPSCGGTPTAGNVWYKFTATSTQSIVDVTNVLGLDPVLSIYATCGGSSVQCADLGLSDEDETIQFTTVIGTVYLINVQQYDAFDGTFCVAVSNFVPPANDDCANAINVTVGAACTAGTTVYSSFDGNSPSCGGTPTAGNVWYKFTATSASSTITLTNVVGCDPILSIYSSCGGFSLQCVDNGLNNGNETLIYATTTGTTYYVNVQQYNANDGTFCVAVNNGQTTAINELANQILIYPNPATDNIKIEVSNFKGTTTAILTNTLGQTIKSIFIEKTVETINLSDISKGTYFLQIPEWNVSKIIIKN